MLVEPSVSTGAARRASPTVNSRLFDHACWSVGQVNPSGRMTGMPVWLASRASA